jgi:Na+/H+ antiporter NhaD/arsenite permease-like protein
MMKGRGMRKLITIIIVPAFLMIAVSSALAAQTSSGAILYLHGKVEDKVGNPVAGAHVEIFLDGKPYHVEPERKAGGHGGGTHGLTTDHQGLFMAMIQDSPEVISKGTWEFRVGRPSYETSELIPLSPINDEGIGADGIHQFETHFELELARKQGPAFWIALLILVGIYILIAGELVHRTLAAMLGAAAVLAITHTVGYFDPSFKLLTFQQAMMSVDWNVIFLLMGMMIIVGVLKESGVFQWMAYKSFEMTGGRVFLLTAVLCVVTAVLSAFLDNVTTMLLLTPVTIELALILGIPPFALLMPEIMASNFGGTATLIGDPPNIMIGSYAGLTFNEFVVTLGPLVVIVMAMQILYTKLYYGKTYDEAKVKDVESTIKFMKEKYSITNKKILYIGGTVLLGVIVLFMLHGVFHMDVSVAALLGGALILILNKTDIVHVLEHDVEWPSLVFFIMLFIIVGAAEETGILQYLANWIMAVCKGDLLVAIVLIMWSAAILSAIVDNIPFTATMLPVVALLSETIPGAESMVLWWALAVGACFGGNATIIGASANVITVGIAEKSGHKITFIDFVKHGTPVTIVSLIMATIYFIIVW